MKGYQAVLLLLPKTARVVAKNFRSCKGEIPYPPRKFHENRKNWAPIFYATSMLFYLKPRHTRGNLALLNMSLALLNGSGAPIRLCGHNSCRNSVQFHLQKLYIWQFSGHGEIPYPPRTIFRSGPTPV